jgi:HK97 family phage major capsid protein/HK97 family phage prohead protease
LSRLATRHLRSQKSTVKKMFKPTEGMKTEAQRGLDWRSEFGRGGTEIGIARARDIVNDRNLSESTVKRMFSFFSRHEVDKAAQGFRPGEDGYPSNGRIAWALWGGDAGFAWSREIVAGLDDGERAMADDLKVGDFVSWNSSGGRARGEIERIITEGSLNVPDSDFTINASEEDPAALIRVYRDGDPTDTMVGHRFSALTKISDIRGYYAKRPYPNEHAARIADPAQFDDFRREADAGGTGVDFIFGIKDGESDIQSIRFDADVFTAGEAREWLDENEFEPLEFEEATGEREGTSENMPEGDTIAASNLEGRKMEIRHIVSIQETEDEYIVTFAKNADHSEDDEAMQEERFSRTEMERRAVHMGEKTIEEDGRRVMVGVSSEQPVERDFGMEVIDHSRQSMNLEFLNSGRAPLLLDHDMSRQIGVVESVELDEETRRLRAKVRFGKGALASEVFNDVLDGIRQNISVGYRIDGRIKREGDPDNYYRVATTPMEISIVSIPADQSSLVGVGRSVPATTETHTLRSDPMTDEVKGIDLEAAKAEAVRAARKNDAEILNLAARHNKRDLGEQAIAKGMSVDTFRGALLDAIGDKPLDVNPAAVELSAKEQRNYSLGRMIQAQITGDWRKAGLEREMHEEIQTRTGKASDGFYVPDFAFRAGPMSTAATGGSASENVTDNFVPTVHRGDMFIEALRARQVMSDLGVTYMSGLTNRIKMPKFSAGANAAFVEELADVSDQSQTDAGVTLQPRTLGAFVEMSRLLMLESVPSIEQVVRNDLMMSIADRIEYYAINGTGSGGQPTGILANASVNNLDISAGSDVDSLTWADIIGLVKLVEEDNALLNTATAGFLSSPAVKAKLASTVRVASTDSVFLLNSPWDELYGYKARFTSNVPTDLDPGDGGNDASALIFGDFSQLMVGLFGAPSIIVNPYSNDKAGTVRITIHQDVDVALRHPESFAKTDEVSVA